MYNRYMAQKCCRSTPRCHRCPVLVKARARPGRGEADIRDAASLVAEILVGRPRALPQPVSDVLLAFSQSRTEVPSPWLHYSS
jgi:hypothetical protein